MVSIMRCHWEIERRKCFRHEDCNKCPLPICLVIRNIPHTGMSNLIVYSQFVSVCVLSALKTASWIVCPCFTLLNNTKETNSNQRFHYIHDINIIIHIFNFRWICFSWIWQRWRSHFFGNDEWWTTSLCVIDLWCVRVIRRRTVVGRLWWNQGSNRNRQTIQGRQEYIFQKEKQVRHHSI